MYYDNDLCSSNNGKGWLHYWAAHLLTACGVKRADLVEFIINESLDAEHHEWEHYDRIRKIIEVEHQGVPKEEARAMYPSTPEWGNKYMSDNQCILMTHRWWYKRGIADDFMFNGESFDIDEKALAWWIKTMTH